MNTTYRMSISAWSRLWKEDRTRWALEMRDRPARFDAGRWKNAIRYWCNEIPSDTEAGSNAGSNNQTGSLAGVPFLVKDLFDVAGEVTGCGSRVVMEAQTAAPARTDAPIVRRLRGMGAHLAGRTHMNEFAYGLDGKNSYTGDCPHPMDSARIAGGSSSGSAWAVAAGIVPFALGTDTGGSVRVPAALCGIMGYRPAWDPHATDGVFPLAPSFDTAGWFAAGAADMMLMLQKLVPSFQGTEADAEADAEAGAGAKANANTEAMPREPCVYWYYEPPGVEIDSALAGGIERWKERLRSQSNGKIRVEPAPRFWSDRAHTVMQKSLDAYNVTGSREAWLVHKDWLDRYRDAYQPLVWSLIDRGRHWSEERVRDSLDVVREMKLLVMGVFQEAQGLIIPATPVPTPRSVEVDAPFREQTIRLNAPGSMAGAAILSVPVHLDAIRSSGLQIIVAPGEEQNLKPILKLLETSESGRSTL
jgi:Asp-tRNA(Asn)/Glu-tRNA(Gln) amidotransferase A subunit family amidase